MTKKEKAYELFVEKEGLLNGVQNAQARIAVINKELTQIINEIEEENKKDNPKK